MESSVIAKFFLKLTKSKQFETESITKNLTDDVAYFNNNFIKLITKNNKKNIILSTDSVVEGYHILPQCTYKQYAEKLFYRNLSDILAKNANPLFYTLNIFLGHNTNLENLKDFCNSLASLNKKFDVFLVGGDTTINHNNQQNGSFIASMTIFGSCDNKNDFSRKIPTKPCNIYITKKIGGAYLGYLSLKYNIEHTKYYKNYICGSVCRLTAKSIFKNFDVSSAIDVSDGILTDIKNLFCNSNKAKYSLNIKLIPFETVPALALKACSKQTIYKLQNFLNSTHKTNDIFSVLESKQDKNNNLLEQKNLQIYKLIINNNFKNTKGYLQKTFSQNDLFNFIASTLKFGDDYNILFTAKANNTNVKSITKIGEVFV